MKRIQLLVICLIPLAVGAQESMKAYSRFDFVPGDKVIYCNTFENESLGELPAGWNTTGSGEVVRLNNSNWVKLQQSATFITDNTAVFSDHFTVEFDLYLDFRYGDALFPAFSFGLLSSGDLKPNSNTVLQNLFQTGLVAVDLNAGVEQNSFAKLISYSKGNDYFNSGEKPFKPLEDMLQQTIHVSIQVQKQRFRLWLNEYKLFDGPAVIPGDIMLNQIYFRVFESSYSNAQTGIYVSNIRVAKGISDTRKKLLVEGKLCTAGILFEVNAATVKPPSYGILREIADVLIANPSLNILIVGHTDASGNEADNYLLSGKRSEAVKQMLIRDFGISPGRMTTTGKGEAEPGGDNLTREGRAQNRRVEFIKQ